MFYLFVGLMKMIIHPISNILYIMALAIILIIMYFRVKFYANTVDIKDIILFALILVDFYLCGHNVPVKEV